MEFERATSVPAEIIFKKLENADFTYNGFQSQKEIIAPTLEGYISDQVKAIVNSKFHEKETVIINAGVGQGKTHTIMQLAKDYYDAGYILVFAVPYKSLIDQYSSELNGLEIRRNSILDYRDIDDDKITPLAASLLNIHLLTINAILGNPGDDFIQQSHKKIEYINLLINRCESENKRVVVILDEIHDGIHNFQEKYIFNLWKWREVVHKIFAISATYNEASKIVIQYLSELTEDKIQIIESQRVKIEEKQSELFLILYNKSRYDFEEDGFKDLFKYLLDRDKKVNVLLYSKSLGEELVGSSIGKLLKDKYSSENINLCVGNTTNRFNIDKCNIGTTFSTGINIKGNDSAFVIFLPSLGAYQDRKLGVFSSGINTLIQAIARVRDKSEVYIITPSPDYLIRSAPQHRSYEENVQSIDVFSDIISKNIYQDLNNQRQLLTSKYVEIVDNIRAQIEYIRENRQRNEPTLAFPTLENFILDDGEKVLRSNFDIFGKNLSIYTFWAAFNDQFLNCRLSGLILLSQIQFEKGKVLNTLFDIAYKEYFDEGYRVRLDLLSDKEIHTHFRDYLYSNTLSIKDGTEKAKIKKSPINGDFERKVITTIQLLKKENESFERRFYPNYQTWSDKGPLNDDETYNIQDYLLACFAHSTASIPNNPSFLEKGLIISYKRLANYLNNFKVVYLLEDDDRKQYFKNGISRDDSLRNDVLKPLFKAVLFISSNDQFIKRRVFSFMQKVGNFRSTRPLDFEKKLYKTFRTTFFNVKEGRIKVNGVRERTSLLLVDEVIIPDPEVVLNLIFVPVHPWF